MAAAAVRSMTPAPPAGPAAGTATAVIARAALLLALIAAISGCQFPADTGGTVDGVASAAGSAAVPDYLLNELELVPAYAELDEYEHAMAVPLGESAFLLELERFLPESEHEASQLLAGEATP